MEELSRSTRIAFGIITVVNAILFFAAVATLLEERFGIVGYLLVPFAALVMSPGLLGLPWFDAWARGEAVSERIFLIWLVWMLCIVTAVALRTRKRRTRTASALSAERDGS
jgi:nucleoside permease NupC